MGVIEVGWSVGRDWEAVEESFFTEVRAGFLDFVPKYQQPRENSI